MRLRAVVGLAVLITASCASKPTPPAGTSAGEGALGVVTGTVVSAPSCPVMQDATGCPPRPVPNATVAAFVGTARAAQVTADTAGRFVLHLSIGRYRIEARMPTGLRSTADADITVGTSPVHITITVDSGIR